MGSSSSKIFGIALLATAFLIQFTESSMKDGMEKDIDPEWRSFEVPEDYRAPCPDNSSWCDKRYSYCDHSVSVCSGCASPCDQASIDNILSIDREDQLRWCQQEHTCGVYIKLQLELSTSEATTNDRSEEDVDYASTILPYSGGSSPHHIPNALYIILGLAAVVLLALTIAIAIFFYRRHLLSRQTGDEEHNDEEMGHLSVDPTQRPVENSGDTSRGPIVQESQDPFHYESVPFGASETSPDSTGELALV